jgi:serine O-acetyltransferase
MPTVTKISARKVCNYLTDQLRFFGSFELESNDLLEASELALNQTSDAISKYKALPREFNIYQTHHNAMFLYKLSRALYLSDQETLSEKVYLLNRMTNGLDLFYKIEMPQNFIIGHGLGTVFSRATYHEYLVIFQGVTIATQDSKYPEIGAKVVVYPNSVISGNTKIGENSVIGAGTILINKTIPSNSIVFNKNGQLTIKDNIRNEINRYFDL